MKHMNSKKVRGCLYSIRNILLSNEYQSMNINLSSLAFQIATHATFVIFSYWWYENGCWNWRPFKALTWVNAIPFLSCFPILILVFSKVNPYDLVIVNLYVIFNESCILITPFNRYNRNSLMDWFIPWNPHIFIKSYQIICWWLWG